MPTDGQPMASHATTGDTHLQVPAPLGSWAKTPRRTEAGHPEAMAYPAVQPPKRHDHPFLRKCVPADLLGPATSFSKHVSSLVPLLWGGGELGDSLSKEKCFPFLFIAVRCQALGFIFLCTLSHFILKMTLRRITAPP